MSTIQEMKEDKRILIHNIQTMLQIFELTHNVQVEAIELVYMDSIGCDLPRVFVNNIEVKL